MSSLPPPAIDTSPPVIPFTVIVSSLLPPSIETFPLVEIASIFISFVPELPSIATFALSEIVVIVIKSLTLLSPPFIETLPPVILLTVIVSLSSPAFIATVPLLIPLPTDIVSAESPPFIVIPPAIAGSTTISLLLSSPPTTEYCLLESNDLTVMVLVSLSSISSNEATLISSESFSSTLMSFTIAHAPLVKLPFLMGTFPGLSLLNVCLSSVSAVFP